MRRTHLTSALSLSSAPPTACCNCSSCMPPASQPHAPPSAAAGAAPAGHVAAGTHCASGACGVPALWAASLPAASAPTHAASACRHAPRSAPEWAGWLPLRSAARSACSAWRLRDRGRIAARHSWEARIYATSMALGGRAYMYRLLPRGVRIWSWHAWCCEGRSVMRTRGVRTARAARRVQRAALPARWRRRRRRAPVACPSPPAAIGP